MHRAHQGKYSRCGAAWGSWRSRPIEARRRPALGPTKAAKSELHSKAQPARAHRKTKFLPWSSRILNFFRRGFSRFALSQNFTFHSSATSLEKGASRYNGVLPEVRGQAGRNPSRKQGPQRRKPYALSI